MFLHRPEKLSSCPTQTRHPQLRGQVARVPESLEYVLNQQSPFSAWTGQRQGNVGDQQAKLRQEHTTSEP